MFEPKDLKSKPTTGRMFPLVFSRVVQQCKSLGLIHYSEQRIPISYRNLKSKGLKEADWLIAELEPKEELSIYSVPEEFDQGLAGKALAQALEAFCVLNSIPPKYKSPIGEFYQAYFVNNSELELCHEIIHWKQRKYRGVQKFSGSGGAQIIKREYKKFVLEGKNLKYK